MVYFYAHGQTTEQHEQELSVILREGWRVVIWETDNVCLARGKGSRTEYAEFVFPRDMGDGTFRTPDPDEMN